MEDLDVGKLWRSLTLNHPNPLSCDRKLEAVIRKLVFEREMFYTARDEANTESLALRDFGIKKEDWK